MTENRRQNGFTLAELLVALLVTSIVLGAVVTLAYALGAADDAADDTTQKQAQVRYATLRISELIRNCKLIFGEKPGGLGVWRADDNGNGEINAEEVVYINTGDGGDSLELMEFSSPSNPVLPISNFTATLAVLTGPICNQESTILVPQCSNVQFVTDSSPPWTKLVSISFDVEENGVTHHYQINTALRAWAGNLLNSTGTLIESDDD